MRINILFAILMLATSIFLSSLSENAFMLCPIFEKSLNKLQLKRAITHKMHPNKMMRYDIFSLLATVAIIHPIESDVYDVSFIVYVKSNLRLINVPDN